MRDLRLSALALVVAVLAVAALGCNLTGESAPIEIAVALTQTMSAAETQAGQPQQPAAATPVPPADTAPPADAATPTPEPSPTTRPPVVHAVLPGNPGGATNFVSDRSSKALANERRAIGDDSTRNWLERPFSADAMEYPAHLDLTRVHRHPRQPAP